MLMGLWHQAAFFGYDAVQWLVCTYLAISQSIAYVHPGTKLRPLKTAGKPGQDSALQSPALDTMVFCKAQLFLPQNQLVYQAQGRTEKGNG